MTLPTELRHAARALARSPGFVLAVLLALVLGLGAAMAVLSVVSAVYLRPLPFEQADRLVAIPGAQVPFGTIRPTHRMPDQLDFDAERHVFDGVAGYVEGEVNIASAAEPLRVRAAAATVGLFSVLAVRPVLGRFFVANDALTGAQDVAVLSTSLWERAFNADRHVIGRSLLVNGRPHIVVGVVDARTMLPVRAEVWVPVTYPFRRYDMFPLALSPVVIGRLAGATDLGTAQHRIDELALSLGQERGTVALSGPRLVPLRDYLAADAGATLWPLGIAVIVLLMIACANVANLMLARGLARRQATALRAALGASPIRLARDVLTEASLLTCAAAVVVVLGLPAAYRLLQRLVPDRLGVLAALRWDSGAMLLFGLALAVTIVASALLPALRAGHITALEAAGSAGRSYDDDRRSRVPGLLMAGQVALAVVLVAVASLMVSSLRRLVMAPMGFAGENVAAADITLPPASYSTAESRARFFESLGERLGVEPGVAAAGITSDIPLSGRIQAGLPMHVTGTTGSGVGMVLTNSISAGYITTMRIPLIRGRDFDQRDGFGTPRVALVNVTAAKRLWPKSDALGQGIYLLNDTIPRVVVGVVGDTRVQAAEETPFAQIYVPVTQWYALSVSIVARAGDTARGVEAIRTAIRSLAPDLPVYDAGPFRERSDRARSLPRLQTTVLAAVGLLALALAAIGVFSVVSYSVARQMRDYGVRIALGAKTWHVVRRVLQDAMPFCAAGVVLGLVVSFWATRVLAALLYEVQPDAPFPLLTAAAVLLLAGAAACLLPAARAVLADPLDVIRGG